MKKWRHFVNTIAPWPMSIWQSLRNLQWCRAFFTAFTSEKWKRWSKKVYSTFDSWYQIFSLRICQSLYNVKQKQSRSGVHLTAQLAMRCLNANYCTRWRHNFKGLSQDVGWADFSIKKTSTPLSLMTTYWMSLISAGFISLDSTFKWLGRGIPKNMR